MALGSPHPSALPPFGLPPPFRLPHPFGLPTAQTFPDHPSLVSFSDSSPGVRPPLSVSPVHPEDGLGPSWVERCPRRLWGLRVPCWRAMRPALGAAAPPVPGGAGPSSALGAAPTRSLGAASPPHLCLTGVQARFCRCHGRTVVSPTRVSCVAFSRLFMKGLAGGKVFEIVRGNMSSARWRSASSGWNNFLRTLRRNCERAIVFPVSQQPPQEGTGRRGLHTAAGTDPTDRVGSGG